MKVGYCQHCGKETTFKRYLGIGSYIGLLVTLGLWAIAIPHYATRCTECGRRPHRSMHRADIWKIKQG